MAQTAQGSSFRPVAEEPSMSRMTINDVSSIDTSATPITVPQPQKWQSSTEAQAHRPHGNFYISEPARRPQYHRAQRSYVSLGEDIPEEWSHSGAQCGLPAIRNHWESEPTSPTYGSDSSQLARSSASVLYSMPQLPKMVGFGRYRHSSTATEEWVREKFCYQLDEIAPLVGDELTIPGCPPRNLAGRKGSDISTNSSSSNLVEEEIDPATGSIIHRGFSTISNPVTPNLSGHRRTHGWNMNRRQGSASIQNGYELLDTGEELANLFQNFDHQSEVEPAATTSHVGPLSIAYHRRRRLNTHREYRHRRTAGQGNRIGGQQTNHTRHLKDYRKITAETATDDDGDDALKDLREGSNGAVDQRRVCRQPGTEAQNAARNHDFALRKTSGPPERSSRLTSTEKHTSSRCAQTQRKRTSLVARKQNKDEGKSKTGGSRKKAETVIRISEVLKQNVEPNKASSLEQRPYWCPKLSIGLL